MRYSHTSERSKDTVNIVGAQVDAGCGLRVSELFTV
jgi:hypothetical protein